MSEETKIPSEEQFFNELSQAQLREAEEAHKEYERRVTEAQQAAQTRIDALPSAKASLMRTHKEKLIGSELKHNLEVLENSYKLQLSRIEQKYKKIRGY